MSRILAPLIALIVVIVTLPATARAADAHLTAYDPIRKALGHSAVPVFLPAVLPATIGSIKSIAVVTADRTGYYVAFSTVVGCSGALSCAVLHVAGYARASAAGRTFGTDRAVRLPDGSRGFYSPRDCSGSHCTQGSLTFVRQATIYEIDANVARDDLPVLTDIYRALRYFDPHAKGRYGR